MPTKRQSNYIRFYYSSKTVHVKKGEQKISKPNQCFFSAYLVVKFFFY